MTHSSYKRQLDDELQRRVTNFLYDRYQRSSRCLHVAADNGAVVLNGKMGSIEEKTLCLSCARRVAGVTRLIDQIDVAHTA